LKFHVAEEDDEIVVNDEIIRTKTTSIVQSQYPDLFDYSPMTAMGK
jgi:hypothetical protein